MFSIFGKTALGAALAAMAAIVTTPAQARPYYDRGGDNDAAIAIGAGVVGLALGAAIASSNRDRYYRDRYYYDRPRYRDYYRYDRPRYRDYYRYDRRDYRNDRRYYRDSYRYDRRDWRDRGGYGYYRR